MRIQQLGGRIKVQGKHALGLYSAGLARQLEHTDIFAGHFNDLACKGCHFGKVDICFDVLDISGQHLNDVGQRETFKRLEQRRIHVALHFKPANIRIGVVMPLAHHKLGRGAINALGARAQRIAVVVGDVKRHGHLNAANGIDDRLKGIHINGDIIVYRQF
ncbi:hypothetical protein SDC9_103998 [bioreactor metagenome]|uniref:Uncharacterized protein n=1 Tax=bioreactor metagenome TaxID=1076179 RepID=A0A645AWJ8_9ZZZZ